MHKISNDKGVEHTRSSFRIKEEEEVTFEYEMLGQVGW